MTLSSPEIPEIPEIFVSKPALKPIVNFSKKSYSGICEYITTNASPEHVEVALRLVKDGLREVCHFDPEIKCSPEVIKLRTAQQIAKCARDGVSVYEKYTKPKIQKLKVEYPGVPVRVLRRGAQAINAWAANI